MRLGVCRRDHEVFYSATHIVNFSAGSGRAAGANPFTSTPARENTIASMRKGLRRLHRNHHLILTLPHTPRPTTPLTTPSTSFSESKYPLYAPVGAPLIHDTEWFCDICPKLDPNLPPVALPPLTPRCDQCFTLHFSTPQSRTALKAWSLWLKAGMRDVYDPPLAITAGAYHSEPSSPIFTPDTNLNSLL
jgi:hypothetical protein